MTVGKDSLINKLFGFIYIYIKGVRYFTPHHTCKLTTINSVDFMIEMQYKTLNYGYLRITCIS